MLGKDLLVTGDIAGAIASHQKGFEISQQLAADTGSEELKDRMTPLL